MPNLTRNAWLLITVHSLHWTIELFLNTFLVAYFLNLTNNNIVPVSTFYIFTYIVIMCVFLFLGQKIKCGNKLLFYRLSFVVNTVSLLIIIYLKYEITNYIWLIGAVLGLEKALFYLPQNLMTSQEAKADILIKFNAYRTALNNIVKIVMPVILGWFISMDSYIDTAGFVLGLAIIGMIPTYLIKDAKPYKKSFNLKALIVLALRKKDIKLSLVAEMLKGLVFDILDVLIVLYIIYMFKTNFNLGIITSIFAMGTAVSNFLFGKFCSYKNLTLILLISSLITIIGTCYFIADTTKFSFIVYNFVFACAAQLIKTSVDVNSYKISQNKTVAILYRTEYVVLREMFLNLGRIIGFTMVVLGASWENANVLKYLILILNIMVAAIAIISIYLNNNLNLGKS